MPPPEPVFGAFTAMDVDDTVEDNQPLSELESEPSRRRRELLSLDSICNSDVSMGTSDSMQLDTLD